MTTEQARELADSLIDILRSRKGFGHWWDQIYEDDKEEIRQEMTEALLNQGNS